jgi:hypothetical protein
MKSPRYVLNLRPEVLIAIGTVSAQWATLEFYVARVTMSFTELFRNSTPKGLGSTSFMERRFALFESICWPNIPSHIQEYTLGLLDMIEAAEDKRHSIIHGMSTETELPRNSFTPDKRIFFTREHPRLFFAEHLTLADINKIADQIADANGAILALYIHLYGVGPPLPSLDE